MKFLQRSILICVIACSVVLGAIEGSAQTTVCSGDSVVLVLNGYKQGDILWEQSSDKTTWSNAQGTQSNDSLFLVATNTVYYRATVTDGSCSPFFSDTTLVTANPTPPVALPATNITLTSFIAHWSSVPGATDYFLDVSTDSTFTTYVPGKKNIDVSNTDTTFLVEGLSCHKTYYYRVRDTSDACPKLSPNSNTITANTDTCPPPTNCGIITDARDGKTYKTIIIGTQCWMAQNLNVGKAIAGEVYPTPGIDNQNASIEKYCYDYRLNSGDSIKCDTFGGLYMWEEMMAYGQTVSGGKGPQGICPTGWHIPTDEEWSILVSYIGNDLTAGGKMKDTASHLWTPNNTVSTNSSGFSALPGGWRYYTDGSFDNQGSSAHFWAATENLAPDAWIRILYYNNARVVLNYAHKAYGFSVRCVKDF